MIPKPDELFPWRLSRERVLIKKRRHTVAFVVFELPRSTYKRLELNFQRDITVQSSHMLSTMLVMLLESTRRKGPLELKNRFFFSIGQRSYVS